MSLKDKASLIFKPSRYKSGKAYSYRGEDFTFTRSSVANRINSAGNLEEVASGVPRLNYDPTDLTKCPVLLLERDSTNYFPYSNDFTQSDWSKDKVTIVPNAAISPDGTNNASLMYINTSGNATYINDNLSDSNTLYRTISAYVKSAGRNKVWLYVNGSSAEGLVHFDLAKKTFEVTPGYNSTPTGKITELKDGWFRIEYTSGRSLQLSGGSGIGISDGNGLYGTATGTAGVYIYGLQIEGTRNATSLIKTNGSSATRAIDLARKTSASSVIGQSEGTIYVEFEYTGVKEHYSPLFSLQGVGSPMELIEIYSGPNGTTYSAVMQDGGVTQLNPAFTPSIGKNKVAFAYATNNSVLVVNGVVIGSVDTSCTIPTLYDIGLGSFTYSSSYSLGDSINEALLFKQRLSAEELASLTSFDTYEELVEAKDLTWESPTITNNRLTALKEL